MLHNVIQSATAQGVELVRVRHLSPARVDGAHPPFVFRENLSQPIPRWQVEARVNATPFLALACIECGQVLDGPHAAGCSEAPLAAVPEVPAMQAEAVQAPAPAPAPALERDTVPAGPAYPRDLAPADLLADIEREAAPVVIHPVRGRIEGEEAQAIREQVLAQPAPALDAPAEPAPVLRPVQAVQAQRGPQQKGRGR